MPDVTLRIKNLSFSLEALSRINALGSSSLYAAIETLLVEEISKAQEESNPIRTANTSILKGDETPF